MISAMDFLERLQIDRQTLQIWIEEDWLLPSGREDAMAFSETDLARARLVRDLIHDMGVNSEGVSVALHLVDQIHGLRSILAETLRLARMEDALRN